MIKEEKIKIKSDDIELGATVAYNSSAKEKQPLILLIAGTGNLDRDGNGGSVKLNLYKDLSNEFVNQGYVCVRYDKRGTHESTGNYTKNTLTNLVDDAKSVIEHCKKSPYVDSDKVIVCGHSEGTMIATLLSEKMDVDGLILLSGAGVSLKEAMYYQNDKVLDEAENGKGFVYWLLRKTVDKEKVHKQVETMYDKAEKSNKDRFFYRGAFLGTKYIQEHNSRTGDDYVEILRNFKGKILAITGTKDVQVDYKMLDKLRDLENTEIYTPEGVNHILRIVDDNNSILNIQKQYKRLSKTPLHGGTMECISSWIKRNFSHQKSSESNNLETSKLNQATKFSSKNQTTQNTKAETEEFGIGSGLEM